MFIDCRHQQMSGTRGQLEAGTSLGPGGASPPPPSAQMASPPPKLLHQTSSDILDNTTLLSITLLWTTDG